ncbi:MAG: autotransporter outer membrane beta-barrel domain-containing protein [Steroidobacter sp.]
MKNKQLLCVTLMFGVLLSLDGVAQTTNVPGITNPNTLSMESYFSDVCTPFLNLGTNNPRVKIQAASQQAEGQLANACQDYFYGERSSDIQQTFIEGIDPTGFIAFKLDSLLFAQTTNDSVMDRMQALRRSQNQVSNNAYNYSGNAIGGGASADESSELLNKPLGLWFRANGSGGTKDVTLLTGKLDDSQFAGAAGVDYRLGQNAVLGGSLGYRDSKAKFGDGGAAGNMDSKTFNIAAYFSSYLYKNLYLDTVINYGDVKYDTRRNILDLSSPPVLYTADGKTNGKTLSGGLALGYEFASGGWTITPSAHYFYTDSKTDAFEEEGSGAYDLDFGKQHYHSSSGRLDLNVSYAINSDAGVWLPHLRTEWIKEFGANIDTFDVRFVNASDTTLAPLPIQQDKLDDQYFRITLGVSAQFRNDVSAYLDYQQLVGFDQVTFYNVAAGLRFQF